MANKSSGKGKVQSLFETDHAARTSILDRARDCAALTKPWVCPPQDQSPDTELPETYQSVGPRGVSNLEGKMLMALWPTAPWFKLNLSAEIEYDPTVPDEVKQQIAQALFLRELIIQTKLESSNLKGDRSQYRTSFRSRKRMAIAQIIVTGDCLEQLMDDYRVKVFRRDQYVTKRDSSCDVLYHIIVENIDPLSLAPDLLIKANIDAAEMQDKPVSERMDHLYTWVQWNPQSKVWVIRQEINGAEIVESEEQVSPFFSTPFELVPGENYGRGFVELNFGDLRTLNELEERRLDLLALAAKAHPVLDYGSQAREEDLTKKSGTPIRARVMAGQVQDIGWLHADNVREFQMLSEGIKSKTVELGKAFLIESDIQPQKERVTAHQIQRIAQELEGALGGVYSSISDNQQLPLLERTIWQLQRDKLMPPLPPEAVRVEALTGISAISKESSAQKIMSIAQVVAGLGPTAMEKVNVNILIDVLARYTGIYEPGLIKSNDQVAQERQQAIALQTQAAAAQQAVQSAGAIAENAANAQLQQGAQ